MNRSTRSILLGSTGIAVALGLAPSANAQDVLETVVVTAEKQATDIQKTAISIEAITPEMTKQSGKVRLGDILEMVPSVSVLQQGAGAARSFFIRGVGVAGAVVSLEDGIAITEGNNAAAFDTARIEVLRGPQSTLYGKGALAGMVNVITNDPTDKYEAKTSLEGGSYNHIQIEALFNVPLSDGLAIRLSGVTQQRTGAINPNKSSGDDYTALRGKLLIHPSEAFRLVLTASMAETKQPGGNDVFPYPSTKVANFASPAFGGFNPCGGNPKVNATADPWHADPFYYIPFSCTAPARPPLSSAPVTGACMGALRAETWAEQATAALEYDMGWSNLQVDAGWSLGASSTGKTSNNTFLGIYPGSILYSGPTANYLFETRLLNPTDSDLKWVAGLYYEHDGNDSNNINRQSGTTTAAPQGTDARTNGSNNNRGVFAQVTVPLVDNRFRVTGGVRYSDEHQKRFAYSYNVARHLAGAGTSTDITWHKVTYRAAFELDLTENSMLYAYTANGFKAGATSQERYCRGNTSHHLYLPNDGSGVVNPTPAGNCSTAGAGATAVGGIAGESTAQFTTTYALQADAMTTYEAGIKNRFLDNKVQVNFDVFKNTFDHLTGSINHLTFDNTFFQHSTDVTGAKSWGAELETQLVITSNDRLNLGISYTPTEAGVTAAAQPLCFNFGSSSTAAVNLTNTANLAACAARNLAANPATVNWVRFRDGVKTTDPLFQAPRWIASASYSHTFDLDDGSTLTANLQWLYKSTTMASTNYFYDGLQPTFHKTDFTLTYDDAMGKWSLSAWVRNIENAAIVQAAESAASRNALPYVELAPPRMWGINWTARF